MVSVRVCIELYHLLLPVWLDLVEELSRQALLKMIQESKLVDYEFLDWEHQQALLLRVFDVVNVRVLLQETIEFDKVLCDGIESLLLNDFLDDLLE